MFCFKRSYSLAAGFPTAVKVERAIYLTMLKLIQVT